MAKLNLELVHKQFLIPTAISLIYKTTDKFDFHPGQFFAFKVGDKDYRSYSSFYHSEIAPKYYPNELTDLKAGKYLGFMVNTKPGGIGSKYFENSKIGDNAVAIGPNGKFLLQDNPRPKIFVASSTGLAPFVEIIKQTLEANPNQEIIIFFGVWRPEDEFAMQFFAGISEVKIIVCCDECPKTSITDTIKLGRVTQIIPQYIKNLKDYDYYICGNQFMVTAMEGVLRENGVTTIYTEKFGG
jgi:all-trans-retinol 13,14-reductase